MDPRDRLELYIFPIPRRSISMVYSPTFTIKNSPDVGKYFIELSIWDMDVWMKHFNSAGDMRGTPVVPKLSEVFRYDNTPQN